LHAALGVGAGMEDNPRLMIRAFGLRNTRVTNAMDCATRIEATCTYAYKKLENTKTLFWFLLCCDVLRASPSVHSSSAGNFITATLVLVVSSFHHHAINIRRQTLTLQAVHNAPLALPFSIPHTATMSLPTTYQVKRTTLFSILRRHQRATHPRRTFDAPSTSSTQLPQR
jgi:hypothetical protein